MTEYESRQVGVLRMLIAGLGSMIVVLLGALGAVGGILYNNSMGQISNLSAQVTVNQTQAVAEQKLVQEQLYQLTMRLQRMEDRVGNLVDAWNKTTKK